MAIALVADAHIGGPGGPAGPLVEQLRRLAESPCERLVLLGDLFQVWVGSRRYETAEVRAVVGALRQLREAGMPIDYVEGNRDFFLAGSPYARLFDRLDLALPLEVGEKRFLAVHGDGINERDRQYLFWRWLSKSRASRALMLHLPAAIARWTVTRTEERLAETNFKHKAEIPEEAIHRFARERLGVGFAGMLLGHFHEERRWEVDGRSVWLLDAWFRSRRVEWLTG